MANAPTARPFRIEVPGLRARTAATRRGAEVALGQMMTQVANGTEGRIVKGAETILVGVAETLGWSTRFEAGTRVRTIRHVAAEEGRIVRIVGYVAVVEMLEGELAGRRLDSYLTHLTPVPMFETIAEFAFAVEAAAGAELGRLFA
jgi:hypothetical protein